MYAFLAMAGIAAGATVAMPGGGDGDDPAAKAKEDDYVTRFRHAQRLFGRGADVEAEKLFRQLIAERPDEGAVHHALATVLQFRRRNDEAAAEFLTACRLSPDDPVIRRDTGMHLFAMGRAAEAEPHLARAHELWPQDVETLIGHGAILRALGRAGDAEKTYREAVAADANSIDAAVGLAACIVKRAPAEAFSLLKAAPGHWADVLVVRGTALEALGRCDDARRDLAGVADTAPPGAAGARFLRDATEALLRCGFAADAEQAAAAGCRAETADGRPVTRAALCLAVACAAQGRADDALHALDGAAPLEREPDDVQAHVRLFRAAVLIHAGRAADAAPLLEALASLPEDRFERAAARRLRGALPPEEFAARAKTAGLANDVEWVESLAAELGGDAAGAARHREKAALLSVPPGEWPGALVRPAAPPAAQK